jgi:predicted ATP-grasp superfamily ATP-dependent carboligase
VQRRVEGEPVSALFLADGRGGTLVLGFSTQWAAPTLGEPFRWGGAVRPARLDPALTHAMAVAVERIAAAAGLVGLNGADFLAREDGFDLIEINPRPGASLDAFPDADGWLFRAHVAACRDGALPARTPEFPGASALAVAYARRAMVLPPGFAWPDWAADRQRSGCPVPEDGPLCIVLAAADDAEAARALALARVDAILTMAEAA